MSTMKSSIYSYELAYSVSGSSVVQQNHSFKTASQTHQQTQILLENQPNCIQANRECACVFKYECIKHNSSASAFVVSSPLARRFESLPPHVYEFYRIHATILKIKLKSASPSQILYIIYYHSISVLCTVLILWHNQKLL